MAINTENMAFRDLVNATPVLLPSSFAKDSLSPLLPNLMTQKSMKPPPLHRHANSFNPALAKKISIKFQVPGSPAKLGQKTLITPDDLNK